MITWWGALVQFCPRWPKISYMKDLDPRNQTMCEPLLRDFSENIECSASLLSNVVRSIIENPSELLYFGACPSFLDIWWVQNERNATIWKHDLFYCHLWGTFA